ncbi:MAG: hypothetical protein QOC93_3501 [Actinomycetota bacterium]|nr:hypothetical protein [Actinomycetota bacterium]
MTVAGEWDDGGVSSSSSGGAVSPPSSAVQPEPSAVQPGPSAVPAGPSAVQPGPSAVPAGPSAVPPGPSAAVRRRGRFSLRDIALSFGVLIVPILVVILGFNALGADSVTRVDPTDSYSSAEASGGFTVLRSEGLGKDWHLTAADAPRTGGELTLRIGLVAPSGRFARFAESGRPARQALAAELGGTPRSTGAEEINGQPWLRYPGRGEEQALVSVRKDVVVVVTGTADLAELRELAASLR